MVGMRTAQCWCWPCLCQLPGMLCLQQARNAHPHPHPTKKPLFGGLQHNPLILCGILKGKTVVMLQKPEEVWGKGAVSWPLAAPKGLAQASVAIRQLTPTGLSLLRWPQKTMPICPVYGCGVFVLGGYWSSSLWSRQGKTLETTLLRHPRLLVAKSKPGQRDNKQATPKSHQNKWNYKKKQ